MVRTQRYEVCKWEHWSFIVGFQVVEWIPSRSGKTYSQFKGHEKRFVGLNLWEKSDVHIHIFHLYKLVWILSIIVTGAAILVPHPYFHYCCCFLGKDPSCFWLLIANCKTAALLFFILHGKESFLFGSRLNKLFFYMKWTATKYFEQVVLSWGMPKSSTLIVFSMQTFPHLLQFIS